MRQATPAQPPTWVAGALPAVLIWGVVGQAMKIQGFQPQIQENWSPPESDIPGTVAGAMSESDVCAAIVSLDVELFRRRSIRKDRKDPGKDHKDRKDCKECTGTGAFSKQNKKQKQKAMPFAIAITGGF